MAQSSVPSVKAALLALLAGRAGLEGVQQEWAHPHGALMRESLWLGDPSFNSEEVAALRPTPRQQDEVYDLPVFVFVKREGDEAAGAIGKATELRWWAIVAEIEDAIRNAPTLGDGIAGLYWAVVSGKQPRNAIDGGGRVTEGVVLVSVHARI